MRAHLLDFGRVHPGLQLERLLVRYWVHIHRCLLISCTARSSALRGSVKEGFSMASVEGDTASCGSFDGCTEASVAVMTGT